MKVWLCIAMDVSSFKLGLSTTSELSRIDTIDSIMNRMFMTQKASNKVRPNVLRLGGGPSTNSKGVTKPSIAPDESATKLKVFIKLETSDLSSSAVISGSQA
jgi:hypothetical protein